jgi:hypothetical protein
MKTKAETTQNAKKLDSTIVELLKKELAIVEAKEAETRAHGTDREWDRAYAAYWALQNLMDKVEKVSVKDYL